MLLHWMIPPLLRFQIQLLSLSKGEKITRCHSSFLDPDAAKTSLFLQSQLLSPLGYQREDFCHVWSIAEDSLYCYPRGGSSIQAFNPEPLHQVQWKTSSELPTGINRRQKAARHLSIICGYSSIENSIPHSTLSLNFNCHLYEFLVPMSCFESYFWRDSVRKI